MFAVRQPTPPHDLWMRMPTCRAWVESVSQLPVPSAHVMVSDSEDWLDSSSSQPAMQQNLAAPAARRQLLPATPRLLSVLEPSSTPA